MADYRIPGQDEPTDPRAIAEAIRQLAAEAAKEEYQRPGLFSRMAGHPGIFSYQTKTQPHYQQDMRTASYLDKVAGMRDQYRAAGRGQDWREYVHPKLNEAIDRREELRSPYINRGALASGQPLRVGLDWAGSIPSNAFNAVRAAAGSEGAMGDLADSVNTTFGRQPEMAGYLYSAVTGTKPVYEASAQKAWEDEQKVYENRPADDVITPFLDSKASSARILPAAIPMAFERQASAGLTTGDEFLGEMTGMQPGWKRKIAGAGLEAALDPVSGVRTGIRALIGRNLPKAALELGSEMALPGMWIGLTEAAAQRAAEHQARTAGY